MMKNTVNTTVSAMPADALFLSWTTGINASGLLRKALAEQMGYRDLERLVLVGLVNEAHHDDEYDLDDLIELTNDIDDLEVLLETTDQNPHHHE